MEHLSIETNAYFGVGSRLQLPQLLNQFNYHHPVIIIDHILASQSIIQSTLTHWHEAGLRPQKVFQVKTSSEPDYDYLDEITRELYPADADILIGIGGGSSMDLAKGTGILLRNPGRGIDYRGMDKVTSPGVPVVLIPTTAGTGSEVTKTASFVDHKSKTKLGINGHHVGCLFSLLDPGLLATCPSSVTGSSGLDALVHAIEAVTTRSANVVSTLLGIEATRLMLSALPLAVREPGNLTERSNTLLGSHYAGIAMWNAGGGPASGLSYPIGVYHGVPHGLAGGILLPHVISMNIARGYSSGYARIYERFNRPSSPAIKSDVDKATAFRDLFFEVYSQLDAPKTFNRWGLNREAIPRLTELTLSQRKANLESNPIPFQKEEIIELLEVTID